MLNKENIETNLIEEYKSALQILSDKLIKIKPELKEWIEKNFQKYLK